jgi:hypothetical protein
MPRDASPDCSEQNTGALLMTLDDTLTLAYPSKLVEQIILGLYDPINLSRLAWADQQIAVLNLSGRMICNAREPHGWQVAYRSGRSAAPSLGGAEPIA